MFKPFVREAYTDKMEDYYHSYLSSSKLRKANTSSVFE